LKWLAAGAAAAVAGRLIRPRRAQALGASSKFVFGQLDYGADGWNPRPGALVQLGFELQKRTSVDAATRELDVTLADPAIYSNPYLWMSGDRELPPFSDDQVARLRTFLDFGGLLVIDSAEGSAGGGFDASVRALCGRLYSEQPLARLPDDHVIYKSFYLLGQPVGRLQLVPYLESITRDEREVVVYCQNDLAGAFAKDPLLGRYTYDCDPGGESQRETAFRLGINLAMYALCLDYKSDQVHVPFILERRKWQPDPE
jgi:hypothetical protein